MFVLLFTAVDKIWKTIFQLLSITEEYWKSSIRFSISTKVFRKVIFQQSTDIFQSLKIIIQFRIMTAKSSILPIEDWKIIFQFLIGTEEVFITIFQLSIGIVEDWKMIIQLSKMIIENYTG